MGLLRFLLAVSVLISHTGSALGLTLVRGSVAVPSFFIISGFYMALILNEKYVGAESYKIFIKNRILRLFPAYWVILLLSFLGSVIYFLITQKGFSLQAWIDYYDVMNITSKLYLAIVNITVVGQDFVYFLQLNAANGLLNFSQDFTNTKPPLYNFLLLPQAWSISAELMFYAIAPLIVRRHIFLILSLMAASLLLRIAILSTGVNYDPWVHRFFPTQLFFFLGGSVSYQIYKFYQDQKLEISKLLSIFIFVSLFTILYPLIPGDVVKQWLYYLTWIFTIPFIFIYTKKNKTDRFLGELSYPIYISHTLIIGVIGRLLHAVSEMLHVHEQSLDRFLGLMSLSITILFSILLIKIIIDPLEKYRQNLAQRLSKA